MNQIINRRSFLRQAAGAAASLAGATALAKSGLCEAKITPQQIEGPFYPVIDQLDKDSDLVHVTGSTQQALGKIILVKGQVADADCVPVNGALVEIWQACESGRYNHPSDTNPAPLDPNFQYWGKAVSDANGNYQFRTIVPGAYPADENWMRPPHIHFKVSQKGFHELTTQLYFAGETLNETDLILQRLSKDEQQAVVAVLTQGADYPIAHFDIVLNRVAR